MKQPRPDPRNPTRGAMIPPAAAPWARFDPRVRSPTGAAGARFFSFFSSCPGPSKETPNPSPCRTRNVCGHSSSSTHNVLGDGVDGVFLAPFDCLVEEFLALVDKHTWVQGAQDCRCCSGLLVSIRYEHESQQCYVHTNIPIHTAH